MFWKLQENILEREDIENLVNFIRTTERFTQFEKVREFEREWSRWQNCKYSIFVNSGSSANLLSISIMKQLRQWREGDEVIVPAVTWVTNISPVFQSGLRPVFVDVNLDDFSFDYNALESKVTPRTRAIFITHLLGFPADISRIKSIVGNRPIEILEDCCEAHGAMHNGLKVGNHGIAGTFSFYWGHHMTTVEGGMVCTDDEDIYRLAVLKRSHGLVRELPVHYHDEYKSKNPEIDFDFLFATDGFNFRNTEFNAVLGLSQIRHLDRYIEIRNRNHGRFLEIIKPYKEQMLIPYKEGISSFALPLLFQQSGKRNEFQNILRQAGIESRPIVSGNLLRQPFLASFRAHQNAHFDFPNAEFLHTNAFYIGNNQFVDGERLKKLDELLKQFFSNPAGETVENSQPHQKSSASDNNEEAHLGGEILKANQQAIK